MTAHEDIGWIAEHEAAAAYVVAHEDALQERISGLMRVDKLFEAGLVAFEHAELLAMLRESPAALQVAEFAILLTQKDMELATYALAMIMEEAPSDPNIHILEAKDELRSAMEENGTTPHAFVRQLAMAYLGDAPEVLLTRSKRIVFDTQYLTKNSERKVSILVDEREVSIRVGIEREYEVNLFIPSLKKKEILWPEEKFYLDDGRTFFEDLGVYPAPHASCIAMAKHLLELPDDPLYIGKTKPATPKPPTIGQRLTKLEEEEQRLRYMLTYTSHPSDMIDEEIKAIRFERARLTRSETYYYIRPSGLN